MMGWVSQATEKVSKGLANLDSSLGLSKGVTHISDVISNDPIAKAAALAALTYATGGFGLGAGGAGAAAGTAASVAPEVLAADLAVYPTAGIVGAIPEAAGIANTIALPGAAIAPTVTPGAASIAPEVLASDLAAYPTSGIVGTLPAAAGPANTIATTVPNALTAEEIAASDLAAYPTNGIKGPLPAAAGPANDIAVPGPSVPASGISALDAAQKLLKAKDLLKVLGIGAGAAAVGSALNKGGPDNSAYQGTIPEYTASRTQYPISETRPSTDGKPYRPGQGGITYFSPMTYTPKAAGGGLMDLAGGGMSQEQYNLGSYSDGGRLLKGPGDGVSDSIPAIIGKKQPARLATGEFVVPARIVSELGNGSTEAGAQRLYEMMDRIQKTRRKTKNVAANTNAAKYLPA